MTKTDARFHAPIIPMLCALLLVSASCATAADWISPGGSGSYAVTKPADGKKPDNGTVKMTLPAIGPNVDAAGKRKVPTNDW